MKNVKINFKVKLLCISFFLLTPLNLHASFWDDVGAFFKGDLFKIRTETPASMKTSDGFFNPKIKVCRGNYTYCDDMAPEECAGVGATYANTYLSSNSNGEPEICACQVFTCHDMIAKGVIGFLSPATIITLAAVGTDFSKDCIADAQCISLPLAPGPPPFCDQFETSPEIRIVPVAASDQSLSQPKIRVIIGAPAKKCQGGSIISPSATCSDGSMGQNISEAKQNLDVDPSGNQSGNISINHGKVTYIFRTYKEKDQLCAGFYGDQGKNDILIASRCFPPPQVKKPQLIPIRDQDGKFNLEKVEIKVPGYNNDNPIQLTYGQERNINGLRLNLGKPKVDKNRNLIMGTNNNNGKVTCLFSLPSWNPDEYVLKRGRIFKYLQSQGKQFNDYRVVPVGDKNVYIPCSKNPKDLNTMQQSDLDSIRPYKGSYYSMSNQSFSCSDRDSKGNFTICCDRDTKGNSKYRTVYKYEDIIHNQIEGITENPKRCQYERVELEGKTYNICSTKYIDENTGEPFFLTKEELEDKEGKFFTIKDPYINNLCIDNFEPTHYTDPKENSNPEDQYHYFNAEEKQCQFVTMEAWGGGAAGFVDKTNSTNSVSGAAGDYTKATVKVNDEYPVFKVKIGSGGKGGQNSGNGTSSEVYMCDKDKQKCKKLIIAGGGGNSIKKQSAAITNESLVYTRFIGRLKGTSENNKIALPYNQGVYTESDDCKQLAQSNQIKKVENNNQISGSGGCINQDKLTYQEGANGKVTITCEQWE